MIEVQHLTKRYGKHTAVDDVSFKIRNGRIYGLLGPHGAGKSSIMNMIAACTLPTEGRITVNGYDVCTRAREVKRQIGYLPAHAPMFADMTPVEFLAFMAEAKGLSQESAIRQVHEAMAITGIDSLRKTAIRALAAPYRQRIGLAQTLLGDPDILLLDEPTAGLDPRQAADIRNLIRQLGEKKTVLVSGYISAEICDVCDRVILLKDGRVLAEDEVQILKNAATPARVLRMSVRGEESSVVSVLDGMAGIRSVTTEDRREGVLTLSVTMEEGLDMRDDIFFAMAERRYAVISMELEEQSLEAFFRTLPGETQPRAVADMTAADRSAGEERDGV